MNETNSLSNALLTYNHVSENNLDGVCVMVKDVTHEREVERQLERHRQLLAHSQRIAHLGS